MSKALTPEIWGLARYACSLSVFLFNSQKCPDVSEQLSWESVAEAGRRVQRGIRNRTQSGWNVGSQCPCSVNICNPSPSPVELSMAGMTLQDMFRPALRSVV